MTALSRNGICGVKSTLWRSLDRLLSGLRARSSGIDTWQWGIIIHRKRERRKP